jgi:transcriptional regulator with XRE-family HTH domain
MGSNLIRDNLIRDIVKEACKRRGISLSRLAIALKINHVYLFEVLSGRKISRPCINKIAEFLHIPDLPSQYELFLSQLKKAEREGKRPSRGR